jgi:enoyl-[acyl-carrier-protein] reductase (NADH)
MKRMAAAQEIAQAALFLLSDQSSFMTGSPMIIDGSPALGVGWFCSIAAADFHVWRE